MVHRRGFLKIYSLNFYFYRILNNENFKMEVEQTKLVTLFFKLQYNYIIDYLNTRMLKFGQISFK